MINVVIPMAGAGSRFQAEGFDKPKPFIDVNGKMMIERVLDGVSLPDAHYTLIIQERFREENGAELETVGALPHGVRYGGKADAGRVLHGAGGV